MEDTSQLPRYNHCIRQMLARASSDLRVVSLRSVFLILSKTTAFLSCVFLFSSPLIASNLGDTARRLADRIAAASGPGSAALEVSNRSSLDEKSVREVRSALQSQLRVQGVRTSSADQAMGTVEVILSESLRDYVWTAQIAIGIDAPRVVLVSLPRDISAAALAAPLPITLKNTPLYAQQQPILDAALLDMPGGARLFVLDPSGVAEFRQQSGHWGLESQLAISRARPFSRDPRGRLLLRRDHLFDVFLPGTLCHSSAAPPLTMNCQASDDPWPLSSDDNSIRAFFAPARNFFTGVLSPGIGKLFNVPSFYSAAPLPRSNYTLWVLTAVDGSVHLIDGITDQAVRAGRAGSEIAAVHSPCGTGTQLLVSEAGEPEQDTLRAFEIPDRDPVIVSVPLEFDGRITALWSDATMTSVVAVIKREDTGWYEANRISVTCAN